MIKFHDHIQLLILTLLMSVSIVSVKGQQIFPVQVTGNLFPPNSLSLPEYANGGSTDLMYIITLRDPVEISRLVKLRLTIMHEGQVVMMTNPNFNPQPIFLEKNVPFTIFGSDLAEYLTPASMMNTNGSAAGLLMQEGINSICLEVIDIARNTPISLRRCLTGYFENSQPPILNSPECGATIPWTETQNILFNWVVPPSSNSAAMMVQYEFTLVRVFDGQNPQEAFLPAQILIQETTNFPSFLYLEGASPLEPNMNYAWRVRAFDAMNANLFYNYGYSPVCTFTLDDSFDPANHTTYTCNNGPCDWTGIPSQMPLSRRLATNDVIQVGHFAMTLLEDPLGDRSGYSGSGMIDLPFLYCKVRVEFNDIKINDNYRVYEGDVVTVEASPGLIPPLFSITNQEQLTSSLNDMTTGFSDQTAFVLDEHLKPSIDGGPVNFNLVSELKKVADENKPVLNMPIGLDQIVSGESPITIAITGIQFSPDRAHLNAVLAIKSDEEWIKFGIKSLCLQPNGLAFAGDARLDLLTDIEMDRGDYIIRLLGLTENEEGTFLTWDCHGFQEFYLKGQYQFDDNFKNLDQPNQPVTATFAASTMALDDILATVDPIDRFTIDGADGFAFEIGQAVADFSKKRNDENINWPEDPAYLDADSSWMGIYVSDIILDIPSSLQFGDSTNTSIGGHNLLIDMNGASGSLTVNDAIAVSSDAFGNWGFSVDQMTVNFLRSSFVDAHIDGGITLPLIYDPISYEGSVTSQIENDTSFYIATLHPAEDHSVGMKLSDPTSNAVQFTVFNTSNITAVYRNGTFQPSAELCGGVAINIVETDFPNELSDVIAELKANLPQPVPFEFAADFDMCLGIDPSLSLYDGQYFNLIEYNGTVTLPGLAPVDLTDALSLLQMELDYSIPNPAFPNLPYKINIPGFPSIEMTGFPDIDVPGFSEFDFSGFPNINVPGLPTITLPAFASIDLPSLPNFPDFDVSSPFMPLGFNFHLPTIPGISLDIGCWAISVPDLPDLNLPSVAVPTIPEFDFALFNVDVNVPEFSCSPANPTVFTIPAGTSGAVSVLFLDKDFDVTQDQSGRYYSTATDDAFFNGLSFQSLIEQLPSELQDIIHLPAGYENYDLAVSGITFDAQEQNAVINVRLGFDGLIFEGSLPIHPKGISFDGATIALGSNTTVSTFGLPGTMNILGGLDTNGDPLSYIRFDCGGILGFELSADYIFPTNYSAVNDGSDVVASMHLSAPEWGQFIGTATVNEPFEVDELPGFAFALNNAIVDFDSSRNNNTMIFPDGYDSATTWRGFYIASAHIVLPDALTFSDGQGPISGRHLLIDNLGISGQAGLSNFLTSGTDNFGGWSMTIDSIGISLLTSEMEWAYMDGAIALPLLTDEIGYVGRMTYEDVYQDSSDHLVARMSLQQDITVGMAMGPVRSGDPLASITLYKEMSAIGEGTEIKAIYDATRDTFLVSGTLCGGVAIDIIEQDFIDGGVPTEIIDGLKEMVGSNISFQTHFDLCLGIDPSLTLYNGAYFDYNVGTIQLALGNLSVDMVDVLSLLEMEFKMPTAGFDIPTINMPGFPGMPQFDLSNFPNISFPSMPGFPDFPDIRMPDFPHYNLPGYPNLPKINLPDPFLPLGFNFDFNLSDIYPSWPSINLGIGLWAYTPLPIKGLPDFDFAAVQIKLPSVGFACIPDNPIVFDLASSPNTVRVDFLDHDFPVMPVSGSNPPRYKYNAQAGDDFFDGLNLRSALDAILTSDAVTQVIGEIGSGFQLPVDIAVTGLTFNTEDGLATLNTALIISIDGSTYAFASTIPMDKNGFYADGIKVGYVGKNQ